MKEDYDILNKYYRNELYNELEDYIKQRRKTFKIDKKERRKLASNYSIKT